MEYKYYVWKGCLVLLILVCSGSVGGLAATVSVVDHGARGDGSTDDQKAFEDTWGAVCGDGSSPTMLVPAGKTFLLSQMLFSGPCKSSVTLQVDGNIVAPNQVWSTGDQNSWIKFANVEHLSINGSGQINGQGRVWWECRTSKKCDDAPDGLFILSCNDFKLGGLKFIDSPKKHISIGETSGVQVSGISVTAPGDSPNTDGLHLENVQHATVSYSTFGTGDDCISIGTGTSDLNITEITCGPGHGISIGSLGDDDSQATVEQVYVSHCRFSQTQNGVRIKTWQGGSGYARGITFENVCFTAVDHPIVIDQFYCNGAHNCPNKTSAVQVSDVQFVQATGTSSGDTAVSLKCSQTTPCTGITLDNVNIGPSTSSVGVGSFCFNAEVTQKDPVVPAVSCSKS